MLRAARQFGALALFGICLCTYAAAQAPPGWRVLKSVSQPPAHLTPGGQCSIAVPGDWRVIPTVTDRAEAHSPDGNAKALVQEWSSNPKYPGFLARKKDTLSEYQRQKSIGERVYHKDVLEVKVLEDSPTRLNVMRVSTDPLGSGVTDWTLLAPGSSICYASITLFGTAPTASPADRAAAQRLMPVMQKIVASFVPAR